MRNAHKNQTLTTLKKFKFTNVMPAILCRQQIIIFIQSFDQDQDQMLNDQQITNLLHEGLKISTNQLSSAMKKVYQYDIDKDSKLTYKEMTNFITEYYFQNLISKENSINHLSNKEFFMTLQKTVAIFNLQISEEDCQNIFNDIDLKRTGHISIEQYKQFICDYFGSDSHAAAVINCGKYNFHEDSHNNSLSMCQTKIARLVFSQLKVAFMKYDFTRSLSLTIQEAKVLLAQIFGLLVQEQQQLLEKKFNGVQKIRYEDLMKEVVLFYVCEIFFRGDNKQLIVIKAGTFVELVHKAFYFVRVKPSPHDLECVFLHTVKKDNGALTRIEYIEIMKNIFENYKFPEKEK